MQANARYRDDPENRQIWPETGASSVVVLVHGLAADQASVAKARAHITSQSIYGKVSVERSDMKKLPYAENLVNLIVAEDLPALLGKGLDLKEVFRVLAPYGALCFAGKVDAGKLRAVALKDVKSLGAWTVAIKPYPQEMDEWTHPFHGPSGNPVSQDMLAGVPSRVRWVDGPLWPVYKVGGMCAWVSTKRRVFYIQRTARFGMPGGQNLVARDAFNGTILWTRPVPWYVAQNGRIPRRTEG